MGKRRALIIAGAVVAIGAISAAAFFGWRAMRAEASRTETCSKIEAFQDRFASEGPLITGQGQTVAVLGDSYSEGWLLEGGPADAWPALFGATEDVTVYVEAFAGTGLTGSTYCPGEEFATRIDEVNGQTPDTVIIQTGLNDLEAGDDEIRADLREIAARLEAERIVVVGPPLAPQRNADDVRRVDAVLADTSAAIDADYVSLLDLKLPYLDDDLHTTRDGHSKIAAAVAAAW